MSAPHDKQTLYPNLKRGSGGLNGHTDKNRPPTVKHRGQFKPGNNANPKGRPPGPSPITLDIKALARTIVEDPIGLARLRTQYQEGQLPPPVLCMLFHYSYGKPKERIEVQGQVDVLRFVISNQPEPLTLEADASSTLSPAEPEPESERVKKPNET